MAATDPRLGEQASKAPIIASKGGYGYVGDWGMRAAVHEVKDHSLAHFEQQLALTRESLPRLNLYQVHSQTFDSPPLFDNVPLLEALAEASRRELTGIIKKTLANGRLVVDSAVRADSMIARWVRL